MAHQALGAEALDIECAEAAGLGTAGAERSEVPRFPTDRLGCQARGRELALGTEAVAAET